jgi:hypothetical protein
MLSNLKRRRQEVQESAREEPFVGAPSRGVGYRVSTLTKLKLLSTYTVTGVPSLFVMCAS